MLIYYERTVGVTGSLKVARYMGFEDLSFTYISNNILDEQF